MKILLVLFLAGCAVKCDESSNYIVQMPVEDTPIPRLEGLKVYWNIPTMQCRSKKVPFDNLEQFGIIQNANDSFRGDKITILYDPGYFPALIRNKTTWDLTIRNGGVPQEGNLDWHLKKFASDLREAIPDRNFSGIGIIDLEFWKPIFRQNFVDKKEPYQSYSKEIERKRHPLWTENMIKEEAKNRFESAGRLFRQYTLTLARKMRPLAKWGYYGYPYCYNTADNNINEENCARRVPEENDQLDWLWENSTALYPSVYGPKIITGSLLVKRIRGRIREAARVRRHNAPILPYFSFVYRDKGYFSEADLYAAFDTFASSEASGVIIWESSDSVNTLEKCENLYKYVYTVFGPLVAKYVKGKKSYKPVLHLHDDDKINEADNIIKENYTISSTSNELSNIFYNVTTLKPVYDTESSTQSLDISTYFNINNETAQKNVTSPPYLIEETEATYNNDNLEMIRIKNKDLESTTNIPMNYNNTINKREYSTESPEHTTNHGIPTNDLQYDDDSENDKLTSTVKDLDFSSVTTVPDKLTSNTTIKQVTGWEVIHTLFTIISGLNIDNSTSLVTSELDAFETSTYFKTDLLMNNLSDFTSTNSETIESNEIDILYSTQKTKLADYETTTSNKSLEFTIINGLDSDNSTDLEDDSELEILDEFETSTYFGTDLLTNNLSDFTFMNTETTESNEVDILYSIEMPKVSGWDPIFSTLFSIVNGLNSDNSTDLEDDSELEISDNIETSTHFETDLLMNNLSDFTSINIETTTSNEVDILYSTEKTEVNEYDFETTTSKNSLEIIDNKEKITRNEIMLHISTEQNPSEKLLENVELSTEYVAQDIDINKVKIRRGDLENDSAFKNVLKYNETIVNIEDNINISTPDSLEYLSQSFNRTAKDTLEYNDKNAKENNTEAVTLGLENLTPNVVINKPNNTKEIKDVDAVDRIRTTLGNLELTTETLQNNNEPSTMRDITLKSYTSVPIMMTNENTESKDVNNTFTVEKLLDKVENTTKDNLDYSHKEKTYENIFSKPVTLLPESYSAETIKQVPN